jgi:hypothetical protein
VEKPPLKPSGIAIVGSDLVWLPAFSAKTTKEPTGSQYVNPDNLNIEPGESRHEIVPGRNHVSGDNIVPIGDWA